MSLSLGMRAGKSVGEKVHFIGTAVARPAGTKVPLTAWYGVLHAQQTFRVRAATLDTTPPP
jgi:hypothetical protein